jgi:hypothetical protein
MNRNHASAYAGASRRDFLMNNRTGSSSRDERGQVLVIVAAAMIGLIAMVALVIDGGYAWGQQRETQNGADAAAKAGTAVIQQMLGGGTVTGNDVACAVAESATDNDVLLAGAEYTDFQGNLLGTSVGACGSGGALPAQAQGVKVEAEQLFDTFLAGVIGLTELKANADATAVVAIAQDICPANQGCAVLPVTFPRTVDSCDKLNQRVVGTGPYVIHSPQNGDVLDASNLAILPLCNTANGSVGWLEFGCGNLRAHINNPCNGEIPLPTWLKASTGNVNCCETDLEAFTGTQPGVPEDEDAVVQIPLHDFACAGDLPDAAPITSCASYPTWSGDGGGGVNGTYYHIPYAVGFKLDGAFVQGADPQCNQAPGAPLSGRPGGVGCLKGWFVSLIAAPGPLGVGAISPGDPVSTGILLIN